jgi:invasion protein IalB
MRNAVILLITLSGTALFTSASTMSQAAPTGRRAAAPPPGEARTAQTAPATPLPKTRTPPKGQAAPPPAATPMVTPPPAASAGPGEQKNWIVHCGPPAAGAPERCTMLQNLTVKSGDQQNRLLTVLIQAQPDSEEYILLLSLPHGLFLPAGAQIQIDEGKPEKIVIQTSDVNGSYAGTKLTPQLLADLRKGQTLKVTMLSANQKGFTIPVTLAGFGPTYEQFAKSKK